MKKLLSPACCLFPGLLFFFLVTMPAAKGQIAITNDGTPPHPSAMLDVKSATKGMLIPRTSTATRNSIPPVKGLLVYDTTANKFYYHNGGLWTEMGGSGGNSYWTPAGNHILNGNSGNVGIGLLPPYKFSVDGDVYFTGAPPTLRMSAGPNAFPRILFSHTNNAYDYIFTHVVHKLYIGRAGGFLGFYSDIAIDTTGYVGIGSASPKVRLHVEGGTDVGNAGGGFLQLGSNTSTNIALDNNEIQARNNGAVSRLVLQNGGGGVQIGSTAVPSGYALAVTGKVICEELRIKLASSPWPDYVFSPQYRPMPLAQLERFISRNCRLPGIPSAATVEQEGVAVGDLQKQLLEKIEELTLYVIELKKEIDVLKRSKK